MLRLHEVLANESSWHEARRHTVTIRRAVPDIATADVAASRRFYTDFLGFVVGLDLGWVVTFVSPDIPTTQVTVMTADATAPIMPGLSIEVGDVDGLYAAAQQQALEIVYPLTDEPWGVRRFFVRDPNGVVVNVLGHRADT